MTAFEQGERQRQQAGAGAGTEAAVAGKSFCLALI